MSNDNAELLSAMYDAFARGDVPTVMAALDEDVEWHIPAALPHAMDARGRDEVGAFFEKLASTWDEFGLEIDDLVASGDRVCAIGRAKGTLDGDQSGYGFVHAWTVRDGVCVRLEEYVDASPQLVNR
jgi:uncharacterized protein